VYRALSLDWRCFSDLKVKRSCVCRDPYEKFPGDRPESGLTVCKSRERVLFVSREPRHYSVSLRAEGDTTVRYLNGNIVVWSVCLDGEVVCCFCSILPSLMFLDHFKRRRREADE
jgi:hypothetical protein